MARIGKLFIQSSKDHLPAQKALKRLGIEGQGWDAVIRRTDLDLYGDVDVHVKSSSLEMRNSQLKKEARMKELDSIVTNPVLAPRINADWVIEEKLRSGGEYDDATIKIAMDTKNYGNKEEVAYAHTAIQAVQAGEKPETFYGATTLFMQIIHDFAVNNRPSLGPRRYTALIDFAMAHAPIVQENMARKAQQIAATTPPAADGASSAPQAQNPLTGLPAPAGAGSAPSAAAQVRQVANNLA